MRHFPQIRFRDGEKQLWNPVLKKRYKDLPEERVRLALVDYLHLEAGFSYKRISFESPVKLAGDKNTSRTDLICYDEQFRPHLLVECKAPQVALTEAVLHQAARYNAQIQAPFLLITNGKTDLWADLRGASPVVLMEKPEPYRTSRKPSRDISYWSERGFMGSSTEAQLQHTLRILLTGLFEDADRFYPYLDLAEKVPFAWPSGYYHIAGDGEQALALSLHATPEQGTILTAILNINGQNVSFLRIDLDALQQGRQPDSIYYLPDLSESVNIQKVTSFDPRHSVSEIITELSGFLQSIITIH